MRSLNVDHREKQWSMLMALSLVVLFEACAYLAPPASAPEGAVIIEDGQLRAATVQDAIRSVGFKPVFPDVLLPNTNPEPQVTARLAKAKPARLELEYTSETPGFLIIIQEWPASGNRGSLTRLSTDIEGVTVFYTTMVLPGPTEPNFHFLAQWDHRSIWYDMRIIWQGEPPNGSATEEERVKAALAIVRSMIQAANRA